MSEAAARETFKKHIRETDPDAHVQRFEDRFHSGIADMNVCFPAIGEWWVEAKHMKGLPKLKNTPIRVTLRREQVLWLNARKRAGGRCMVLVRIGLESWAAFDGYFDELEAGVSAEKFFALARWHGNKLNVSEIFELPQRSLDL